MAAGGSPSSGRFAATFFGRREKGSRRRPASFLAGDEGPDAPPLPLAGEGWGKGKPQRTNAQYKA